MDKVDFSLGSLDVYSSFLVLSAIIIMSVNLAALALIAIDHFETQLSSRRHGH